VLLLTCTLVTFASSFCNCVAVSAFPEVTCLTSHFLVREDKERGRPPVGIESSAIHSLRTRLTVMWLTPTCSDTRRVDMPLRSKLIMFSRVEGESFFMVNNCNEQR